MFKKFALIAPFLFVSVSQAAFDIRESSCYSTAVGAVSVSTVSVTQLSVGTSNLTGRTQFYLINTSPLLSVYIGTHSAVTVNNGYQVYGSTLTPNNVQFPIGSNITLYGIANPNPTVGTANVRILECAQ